MSEEITLEFVKAYRRSFDDTGSGKSKLAKIVDELIRRMEDEKLRAAFANVDDAREPPGGTSDDHPWTDEELKIHMENSMWLTRTVCKSLLRLRAAARSFRKFMVQESTHRDGCAQARGAIPSDVPCSCGHNRVLNELDAAIKS